MARRKKVETDEGEESEEPGEVRTDRLLMTQPSMSSPDMMITKLAGKITPSTSESTQMMTRIDASRKQEDTKFALQLVFAGHLEGEKPTKSITNYVMSQLRLRISEGGKGRGEVISVAQALMNAPVIANQTWMDRIRKMTGV
jgi:hypothetical protein